MKLQICNELKEKLPLFSVSAYTFTLLENNNSENLSLNITKSFEDLTSDYQNKYTLEEVVNIERIKVTRDGYKKLGKDPSHTRPACEALLRRILKYGNIYRLGNVIDVGNLISLKLLKSVCVVDLDQINGDVLIRIGTKEDEYYGINRGKINVDKIPLYTDSLGGFGNPTSDTLRTAITSNTKNVLVMLINFSDKDLNIDEEIVENILNNYLKINNFKKLTINYI